MANLTLDAALAGMRPLEYVARAATGATVAGRPVNISYLAGSPSPMVAPTSGINDAATTLITRHVMFSQG